MKKLLIGLLLSSQSFAVTTVPLNVFAYDESTGKEQLKGKQSASPVEFLSSKCKGPEVAEHFWTPCMIGSLVKHVEDELLKLGLEVKFQTKIEYTDFKGYDVSCKKERCLSQLTSDWKPYGFDILLMPKSNRPQADTRRFNTWGKDYFVIALDAGSNSLAVTKSQLTHEFGHGMGFDMHTNSGPLFVFNPGRRRANCQEMTILPYSQSGLSRDCKNYNIMGSYLSSGCLVNYSFAVPYYTPVFREVFGCWLRYNGITQVPPPIQVPKQKTKCELLKEEMEKERC